jgi:hypothetical protein
MISIVISIGSGALQKAQSHHKIVKPGKVNAGAYGRPGKIVIRGDQ